MIAGKQNGKLVVPLYEEGGDVKMLEFMGKEGLSYGDEGFFGGLDRLVPSHLHFWTNLSAQNSYTK